jgi:hypothetical protein
MGGDLSSAKTDYSHGIDAQTAQDIFHRLSLPQHRSTIESSSLSMKSTVAKFSICGRTRNDCVSSKIKKVSCKCAIERNNMSNQCKTCSTSFNVSSSPSNRSIDRLDRQCLSRWNEYSNIGNHGSQFQFISFARCSTDHSENVFTFVHSFEHLLVVVIHITKQQQSRCSSTFDQRSGENVLDRFSRFRTWKRYGQWRSCSTHGRFANQQISVGIEGMYSCIVSW